MHSAKNWFGFEDSQISSPFRFYFGLSQVHFLELSRPARGQSFQLHLYSFLANFHSMATGPYNHTQSYCLGLSKFHSLILLAPDGGLVEARVEIKYEVISLTFTTAIRSNSR